MTKPLSPTIIWASMFFLLSANLAWGQRSHRPMRPLPTASDRPLAAGPAWFVDADKGNDQHDGSLAKPWKTINHAVTRVKPGDTLYLRGGTYYEHVTVSAAGSAEKPITIRSYPGERVFLDGGLQEFAGSSNAWEPCPGGVEGEYRSTRVYPDLGGSAGATNVLGNFGDSMVPLHGYRFLSDLRSSNVYWKLKSNVGEDKNGIYCGPGLYYDTQTGRIHVRLAHTNMKYLPWWDNYRGVTDPRHISLVVAGLKGGPTLALTGCRHVRLQDLVVRGSRAAAVEIKESAAIDVDGLTVYGGQSAFAVKDTAGLRLRHTACRGIAAPWTFRGSLKYRAIEARIFSASGWEPTGADNRDFELAYCEFTDSVDGIFLGNVRGVHFHHNLVDNISDDGIFLTATTACDGTTPGGDVHIYQNLLSRCLTTLAFGVGHGRQRATAQGRQTGAGVHVYRNVFDYRRPVMYHQPASPDEPQEITSWGRFASDHGGPLWEPMHVYHNTFLTRDPPGYTYGTAGWTDHIGQGTHRRIFNNILVNVQHMPGFFLPPPSADLHLDGNLLWSAQPLKAAADPLAKFRQAKGFADSQKQYPPGWTASDQFKDPKFSKLSAVSDLRTDWKEPMNLSLQKDSPAIDAGVALPAEWPDPVRSVDVGKPDLGALPQEAEPWRVGVDGRLTMFGGNQPLSGKLSLVPWPFAPLPAGPRPATKPAAIVAGYPELDAPLLAFALKKHGLRLDLRDKSWLEPRDYHKYSLVVIAGDLQRAGTKPDRFAAEDLGHVRDFLNQGGALWLLRRSKRVFDWTPQGKEFLQELIGPARPEADKTATILDPQHPWIKHLDAQKPHPWLVGRQDRDVAPWRAGKGECILGTPGGACLLYRLRVGKGQLVFAGWQVADSLPSGRAPATVAQEQLFAEQMQIFLNMVADLYPPLNEPRP